jgi:uncharacterized protein YbjT (DUF2867 family)
MTEQGRTAGRRAVVRGATGAVGSALLRELLAAPAWAAATAVVRRSTTAFADAPGAEKLAVRVVAMDEPAALERDTAAALADLARSDVPGAGTPDVAFCTLGVGQPRKVSPAEHRRVDVDLVVAFARACRAAGVAHFSLLTSVGADAASRNRYLKVKGDVEAAVRALGFPRVSFVRPSLLVTRELRYGLQDLVTQWIVPKLSPLLPSKYHEIRVEDLARAMRLDAERGAGPEALEYPELSELLATR